MSRQITAVYPGTFDPITLGHEDIVRRAAGLFDRVIVAVATAYHKKTLFTLDERLEMTREALADLPQVSVASYDGLVRDFVRANGAQVMVRGLRAVTDFDYEFHLAGMNRHLMPEVETLFLTPPPALQSISSTFVREIALLGGEGEVGQFVSPGVLARLQTRARQGSKPGV